MSMINESKGEAMTPRENNSLIPHEVVGVHQGVDVVGSLAGVSEEQMCVIENQLIYSVDTMAQLDEVYRSEALYAAAAALQAEADELRALVPLHHDNSINLLTPFMQGVVDSSLLSKADFTRNVLWERDVREHVIKSCVLYVKRKMDNPRLRQLAVMATRCPGRLHVVPPPPSNQLDQVKVRSDLLRGVNPLRVEISKKDRTPRFNMLVGAPAPQYKHRKPPATAWRVPFKFTSLEVRRPTNEFGLGAFKKWANWECSRLHKTIPKDSKTSFVSGNLAAETLWYTTRFSGTVSQLRLMIQSASFYTEDYRTIHAAPPVLRAAVSMGLVVHGMWYASSEKFASIEHLFYANKAVFRFAMEYLRACERNIVDPAVRARIQSTLDKRINNTSIMVVQVPPQFIVKESDLPVAPVSKKYLQAVVGESWVEGSITYQGNIQPTARVEHTINFPQTASVADAVQTIIGDTAMELGLRHSRTFVQFISFFTAITSAHSVTSLMAAITQFIAGNESAWKYVTGKLQGYVARAFQGDGEDYSANMSFSTFVRDIGTALWDAIVGAGLFILVDGMMGEIKTYVVGPLQELISSTRISLMREGGKAVATSILTAISTLLSRIKKCWELQSFAPLWGEKWDPVLWCTHMDNVVSSYTLLTNTQTCTKSSMQQMDALRAGALIPSWWLNPLPLRDYCCALEDMLTQGSALSQYFVKNVVITKELTARMVLGRNFLMTLKVQCSAAGVRPKPFYCFMYGSPGGGKTVLQKLLAAGLAKKFSLGDVEAGTFQLALNENFQSGLNHHKWCVVADDVDHSVAPPSAGALNHIELLTKLVNNEPFRVEESESSLKGHTFASPSVVFQQSNFPGSRVTVNTHVPAAWWRRIDMYVTIAAKKEYGTDGILNSKLAQEADTYDIYDITVQHVDYARLKDLDSNVNSLPLTSPKVYSFAEFTEYFYTCFEAHRTLEMEKVNRFTHVGGFCPVCFMPTLKKCGHEVVAQGRTDHCAFVAERVRQEMAAFYLKFRGITFSQYVAQLYDEAFWVKMASGFAVAGALALIIARIDPQGRVANACEGMIPKQWFRADQTYIPGVPTAIFSSTYTYDDLIKSIRATWVEMTGGPYSGPAVAVGHNTVLFPTHYCPTDGRVTLSIGGRSLDVVVDQMTRRYLPHSELSLLRCGNMPGLGGLRAFILPTVDEQVAMYDEMRIVGPKSTYTPTEHGVYLANNGRCIRTNSHTVAGDCGSLYIGRIGTSWRIVGMHFAGTTTLGVLGTSHASLGAVFSLLELERAATALATVVQGVYTSPLFLAKDGVTDCTQYPLRSEVWAAVSSHGAEVTPFGTLERAISGMTMKTRITRSLVEPHVLDLIDEWCGQSGYWHLPNFRGAMVDDSWTSPYTDAFRTQNKGKIHGPTMWLALADYLSGLNLVDVTGYAELSEEQMITGVPGSYVHSVNMRTSVGPPYNVKKPVHIAPEAGNSYMSPEMWSMYDDTLCALENGIIPSPLGLCILKDEALKPGKMPRVFTVFSAAFNLICKKKWLFKSLMRANPAVFESTVGINMTGNDALKLVHAFQSINPQLDGIFEADAVRLDKSFNGELFDFVALAVYAMTHAMGLNAMHSYLLLLGIKHTRFCIKNDLFSVFWNGSGNDATVEINGICMSLGQRYVYYREKYKDVDCVRDAFLQQYMSDFFQSPVPKTDFPLTFRSQVVLWTYGDDQLFASLLGVSPRFEEIWAQEIGIVMTDASKLGKMRPKKLVETQYLKRNFRFDEEFGRWVTPLDKKTLARMLAIRNDSTLTTYDSAAISMTECLREAVYHGREFYALLRERFEQVAQKIGVRRSSYLRLPEFDFYKEQILAGTFQTWVDRSEILKYDLTENVEH